MGLMGEIKGEELGKELGWFGKDEDMAWVGDEDEHLTWWRKE